VLFAKYSYNYDVEEDQVFGACCANVEEEERAYIIDKKALGKGSTRKTKTQMGG
jgi:hypothetical protein